MDEQEDPRAQEFRDSIQAELKVIIDLCGESLKRQHQEMMKDGVDSAEQIKIIHFNAVSMLSAIGIGLTTMVKGAKPDRGDAMAMLVSAAGMIPPDLGQQNETHH